MKFSKVRSVCLGVGAWLVVCTSSAAEPLFLRTHHTHLHFANVEVLAKNPNLNESRRGEILLKPYVRLTPDLVVGIDEAGALMQVIATPRQTVALTLGQGPARDLFIAPAWAVLTIERAGELSWFDQKKWAGEATASIGRRYLRTFGYGFGALALLGAGFGLSEQASFIDLAIIGGPLTVALGMLHALRFAAEVSESNLHPDGLTKTGIAIGEFSGADRVGREDDRAADYVVHGRDDSLSLKMVIGAMGFKNSKVFRSYCESALSLPLRSFLIDITEPD